MSSIAVQEIREPGTRRLGVLIGRRMECAQIEETLKTGGMLFLEGGAGIGKTFLLEHAAKIGIALGLLAPPCIDFYDAAMHSHAALEAAIAGALDPDRHYFSSYWTRREKIGRGRGAAGLTTKEQSEALWRSFLEAYRQFVEDDHAVLLRFDTVERLEYEQDSADVVKECEVELHNAPSWEWLMHRVRQLPSTAVLVAARPTPSGVLKQNLPEGTHCMAVEGFSLEETRAYFEATAFGSEVSYEDPDMVEKIHLLSGGRPILIALALDWLERGIWERNVHAAELFELREWKARADGESRSLPDGAPSWKDVKADFEMALVQRIRALNHRDLFEKAMRYVALMRKGFNAVLLARVLGIDEVKAEGLVEELSKLCFVKPPREGMHEMYFLHDEMYDLIERYVWQVDWPDHEEQSRIEEAIIGWYKQQIDEIGRQIGDLAKAGQISSDYQAWAKLRTRQQLLYTDLLYYQFDADPRAGYREYSHLDEEAIGSREQEWDMVLRNEALAFTSYRGWRLTDPTRAGGPGPTRITSDGKLGRSPAVDYDCRRRWVSRYVAQCEYVKAMRVAESPLSHAEERNDPEEPELYRGGVLIGLATAQTYAGGEHTAQALANFEKGIRRLLAVPDMHKERWLYPYLLGTAYLYQGLALTNALRLKDAQEANNQAIQWFLKIDHDARIAEALNNQSYVYARQGRLDVAECLCERALAIRERLGDEYEIGLSRNTQGIIFELQNRPISAITCSRQAREMFRKIGSDRGLILAHINLGRSSRRKSRNPEWGKGLADLKRAARDVRKAIRAQEELGVSADVFYRIEALDEMACIYRDFAAYYIEREPGNPKLSSYLDQAEGLLRQALKLTEDGRGGVTADLEVQNVDCQEDLARVFYHRAQVAPTEESRKEAVAQMQAQLDEAEGKIRAYERRLGFRSELELILGKIYLQRARLARLDGDPMQAGKYYAAAAGYAEAGGTNTAPQLRKYVEEATEWLSSLPAESAGEQIRRMYEWGVAQGRESSRLQEWVDATVQPWCGVGWPQRKGEAQRG